MRKTQIADVFALVFLLKLKPGCVRVGAVGRVCHRATIRLKTAKEREVQKERGGAARIGERRLKVSGGLYPYLKP